MKSREIKFRAWDKRLKEMLFFEGIFNDTCYFDAHNDYEDLTELMQYTGLKDKNGKEIYEGDILKHDLWGVTKVYWEDGSFWADNGKDGSDYIEIQLGNHQLQRTRIIGNIWENSELLNESK